MEKGIGSIHLIIVSSVLLTLALNPFLGSFVHQIHGQPSISDTNLIVQPVIEGLSAPTDMIFLDKNNILVLEQEGNVRLVSNGTLQDRPVLQVPVNTTGKPEINALPDYS